MKRHAVDVAMIFLGGWLWEMAAGWEAGIMASLILIAVKVIQEYGWRA